MLLARIRGGKPAQALTEFALVIPILMMVVLGIVDLGRGVYSYNVLASAAREGARYGIVHGGTSNLTGIKNRVQATATLNIDPTKIVVSCPGGCTRGDPLTVTVQYVFVPATPLFTSLTMTGQTTMTME